MPHPANRLNTLQAVRHATKSFEVTVKDQDGRPVKLGGATLIMSVGLAGGPPLVVKRSDDQGIEITDADKGKARVTLSSADTAGLTAGTHKYDFWIEWPGDPVVRYQVIKLADLVVSDGMTAFE